MQSQNYKSLSLVIGEAATPANIQALFSTTKPNIVALTLVAALTGMYVGNQGVFPDGSLIVWTLISLGLATAGACMLNNIYDQDIDRVMKRTRTRAMASGSVSTAIVFPVAIGLCTVPVVVMAVMVNYSSAFVTVVAIFGYAVVYTMWAKRRTSWANQIGGVAGALPPVIGYVAVTGSLDVNAFVLFAIMAIWQQPHALSLALKYRQDYAHAGVPVIPVVKGVVSTKWRMVVYAALLIPLTTLPYFLHIAGLSYLIISLLLGISFFIQSIRFLCSTKEYDMRLFLFSLFHLVVLFSCMMIDIERVII